MVDQLFGRIVLKAKLDEEPEQFAEASPLDHVRPDAPPFLVIHGDKDTLAPVEGARDFVADLRAVSDAPVLYLELKGAQHAFEIFPSIRGQPGGAGGRAVPREPPRRPRPRHRTRRTCPEEALADTVDAATSETVTA